jgi:lipopolysaccharide biosynthesis glycosyltransferase
MSTICKKIGKGATIHILMNGWFMHPRRNNSKGVFDWPPPPCVIPIFASFHVHSQALLSTDGVRYLQVHEPIGCRDQHTVEMLKSRGIDAWFSGCLTMTMDDVIRPHRLARSGVFIVDTKHTIEQQQMINSENVRYVKHVMNLKTIPDPFDVAYKLLKQYSCASQIFTSRLHCMLPSVAMGTRVHLVTKKGAFGDEKWIGCPRYKGLVDLAFPENKSKMLSVRQKLFTYCISRARHALNTTVATKMYMHSITKPPKTTTVVNYQPVTIEIHHSFIVIYRRLQGLSKLCLDSTLRDIDWDNVRRFLYPSDIVLAQVQEPAMFLSEMKRVSTLLHGARPKWMRLSPAVSTPIMAYSPPLHRQKIAVTKPKRVYPVVFTCDKNYLCHVSTVLHSMQIAHAHLKNTVLFNVYLIVRGIPLEDEAITTLRAQIFNYLDMFMLNIVESNEKYTYTNNLEHVTISCLDRLLIPNLVPESVVLYIDLDVLCVGDITPLFSQKIGPTGIVAKKSVKKHVISNWLKKIGQDKLQYHHPTSINAGVLLMDLRVLRKKQFAKRTMHICETYGVNDQIAINMYLDGDGHDLSQEYNAFFDQDFPNIMNPVIIHFAGSMKPWHMAFANTTYARKWQQLMLPPPEQFDILSSRMRASTDAVKIIPTTETTLTTVRGVKK